MKLLPCVLSALIVQQADAKRKKRGKIGFLWDRQYVDYAFLNIFTKVAKEFRAWVQDIKAPEEFFYATLARIDQKSAENPGRFSVVQGMKSSTL